MDATPAATPVEAIAKWETLARIVAALGGGHRSLVWEVELAGGRFTLRRSRRSTEALLWELDLMEFAAKSGVHAPSIVRTASGERSWEGYFVTSWIDGDVPRTEGEWREVASSLQRLHDLTRGWSQRPTFASTGELLTGQQGGDVNLTAMPDSAVALCRQAWRALAGMPTSAIHGDPRGNVLMSDAGPAFIDWDESRVDTSILDLADLPIHFDPASEASVVRLAASAWEAATSWLVEPEYARRRLAELTQD
jgi:Ser/Thr protein kinase RdoA (MazF antagonist)